MMVNVNAVLYSSLLISMLMVRIVCLNHLVNTFRWFVKLMTILLLLKRLSLLFLCTFNSFGFNLAAKLLLIFQIRNIMSIKFIKLFQFQVCGKSIQLARSPLNNFYYVLYRDSHAWRKVHHYGFETYQMALEYAIARSAATIRFNAQLSSLL